MTDKELRDFTEGPLWYEVDMLFETISILISKKHETNRIIHNSLVESFVIHARTLYEFLIKESHWEDNVEAKEFFDTYTDWEELSEKWQKDVKHFDYKKASKALAHLSKDRFTYDIEEEYKKWNCVAVGKELFDMLKVFLDNASSCKVSDGFRKNLSDLETKFDFLSPTEIPRTTPLSMSVATARKSTMDVTNTELQTEVSTIGPNNNIFGKKDDL